MDIIKKDITSRVFDESEHMLSTGKTVREIATEFKVSKSTVHKDLHERLKELDNNLFNKIDKIMQAHIAVRHIKGGESTRRKYAKK